jgi:EmrB/QacA subfamily drug resistance transporter
MGALDTGIVTPARTVIQNYLGVSEKSGIWMITMYTLAYAASIPIMGKLADKYGRKYIYLISIFLFGFGSLLCGLSQHFESFALLLGARAIQAIGGGGIVPVATAEFGTTFPKEKRGMALGLVGGVYGIANIFGSSAGSAILDLFGNDNWQYIFYINVPITIFIVIAGLICLPNTKAEDVKKIDIFGIGLLTAMILSLLYGLKNIDFFDFTNTFTSKEVYPFLLIFIVLLPFFLVAEKKAEDPVMNLSYFKNPRIDITLILSMLSGIILMGMIFVPEFSENALKIPSGDGGYLVIILGVFAGLGAPFSGKLIDKFGVKMVLGLGFLVSAIGSLFLIFIATDYPSMLTIFISLMFVGLGIGFTMGTPLNYMMLDNTKKEESNSALATVSLIRSIGTTIAPAIMIGFIAHAGTSIQGNIMPLLPSEVAVPELPYSQEISAALDEMKANPAMAEKLNGIEIPDLSSMQTVKFDMSASNGQMKLSDDMLAMLQSSDVTTITEDMKVLSAYMFEQMTPGVVANIQNGLQSGITAMQEQTAGLEQGIAAMKKKASVPGMDAQIAGMTAAKDQMTDLTDKMTQMKDAVPGAFETAKDDYLAQIDTLKPAIEKEYQRTLNIGFRQLYSTVAIVSALGLLILLFYKKKKDSSVVTE